MEMKQKSLKLNVIMNSILTMSSFIFPLITFPYVSRVLSSVGTGKVAFATSFISYFSMIAQLGIPTYGIRVCAQVRDDKIKLSKTVHELLFVNMITTILSYIGLVFALIFIPRLQADKPLYIVISITILLNSIGMEWLYKALEQYTYITIRSILFKFIGLIAMFILVHEQKDYIFYGFITIFATSASNVLNFVNAHKYIEPRYIGGYEIRKHLKPIGVFFAMSIAATIYTNIDSVMLGFMTSDADVGYYNAAVRIKTIMVSIVTSLGAVLLPRAAYYIEHGLIDEFYRITSKALNFVFLLASPMMIYFMIFAKEGIFFLSGDSYAGSIVPMQVIMPTILLIGITNISGIQMLIPLGKEKVVLYSEVAGAAVDVIINALLIPSMASVGAAIGTLIAELVVLIVQFVYLKGKIFTALKNVHYIRIVIAIITSVIAVIWIKTFEFGNFVTLCISASLYFGVYGMILLLSKEPLVVEIFNQIIGKIRKG